MSMAQKIESGYVYIISNIGSFGENVFKIGMTRRLGPMDRVKNLEMLVCHSVLMFMPYIVKTHQL